MNEKLLGSQHPDVAANLNNLANALAKVGENEEASELFVRALDLKRQLFGDEHPDVTLGLYKLASFYVSVGRNR